VVISLLIATAAFAMANSAQPTPEQHLGRLIYFDKDMSNPVGQACASCHLPIAGYADPDQELPVSEGAVTGRFGGRNSPSAAYAAFSPVFGQDPVSGQYFGGQFWDGRAPTLEEQAKGPFLNPVEMNNTKEGVVQTVRNSRYSELFKLLYGSESLDVTDSAYNLIAQAIASFERTTQVNRFTSNTIIT
jgi:cytochrome c peroxidase